MATRVLIADDVGFVRELLTQACEALGYLVIGEAVDGAEVIEMAMHLRPDIILMDLVMPKFNGLEATERILKELPETRIIACSSIDDEMTLLRTEQMGCSAFLRKPFTRKSLMRAFQQVESQKGLVKNA
jgi:two-component system, chemotaxis family, chemotaxis protein CheY